MKKTLLSIAAIGGMLLNVDAQQAQNGGMEEGTYTSTFGAADPKDWGTMNFDGAGVPFQTTTLETVDPFEGSTSVKLETKTGHAAVLGSGNDTIAGHLLSTDIGPLFQGGSARLNDVRTDAIQSVSFQYKADVMANDTAFILVEVSDDQGNVIDNNSMMFEGQTSNWTNVNLALNAAAPDSIGFVATSSIASIPFNFTSGEPIPGSILELDNIIFCDAFVVDFDAAVNGGDVDFTSNTTATGNGGKGSLSWDFGDGNTSTDLNPSHTYAANDTYTVALTVTDSCGNDSTYTENVIVDELSLSQEELLNTNVFPNPASNMLNVSAAEDLSKVVVHNLLGRKVMEVEVNGTESKVDISSIPSGTYLIEMVSEKGALSRKQFVKK